MSSSNTFQDLWRDYLTQCYLFRPRILDNIQRTKWLRQETNVEGKDVQLAEVFALGKGMDYYRIMFTGFGDYDPFDRKGTFEEVALGFVDSTDMWRDDLNYPWVKLQYYNFRPLKIGGKRDRDDILEKIVPPFVRMMLARKDLIALPPK